MKCPVEMTSSRNPGEGWCPKRDLRALTWQAAFRFFRTYVALYIVFGEIEPQTYLPTFFLRAAVLTGNLPTYLRFPAARCGRETYLPTYPANV